MCGPRLAAMGIMYEDQREDVADRQLIVVATRLTISPSIIDCIRQTQQLTSSPTRGSHRVHIQR